MFETYKDVDWVTRVSVDAAWKPPYAGIFIRIAAGIADILLLFIIFRLLEIHLQPFSGIIHNKIITVSYLNNILHFFPGLKPEELFIYMLLGIFIFLYVILLTKSSLQGTFGQWLFKIYITDSSYSQLTFLKSLLRFISLASLPLTGGLGFLFSLFSNERKTLHDRISGTIVFSGEPDYNLEKKIDSYFDMIQHDKNSNTGMSELVAKSKKTEW